MIKQQSKPASGKRKHPPSNSNQFEGDLQHRVKRAAAIMVISDTIETKMVIALVEIKEDKSDACRRPVQCARDFLKNTETISEGMLLPLSEITKKNDPPSAPSPIKKSPPKPV